MMPTHRAIPTVSLPALLSLLRLIGRVALVLPLFVAAPLAQVSADFGDAPDNTVNSTLEAYPGVVGRFPSLLDTANASVAGNQGAHHLTLNEEWLSVTGAAAGSTTAESDANLIDNDEDDAEVAIVCTVGLCFLQVDAIHRGAGGGEALRYLNALVDVNRDGEWASAMPFGSFPREHVIINMELPLGADESNIVMSGSFPMQSTDSMWVRVTLSRTPIALPDADMNNIIDEGWDGSAPSGGFMFGETEDHLVTPQTVAPTPVKEPPSNFSLAVAPNPVPVPPGNFAVNVTRKRAPGGGQIPVTLVGVDLWGCQTTGVGLGINIPAPAGHGGAIVNDAGAIRSPRPPGGFPPVPIGALPTALAAVPFVGANYPPMPDSRLTICRVRLVTDPPGDAVIYDAPFQTQAPVRLLEQDPMLPPIDRDGDGVPDVNDACSDFEDPLLMEDLDGSADDDGCLDPDNDNDTVLDEADECPLDLEDVNGVADDDGCPDPAGVFIFIFADSFE